MIQVDAIAAFSDNYIWCLHQDNNDRCVVVDPGSAQEVITYLKENKLVLEAVLITHHHWDHTNGLTDLIDFCNGDLTIYASEHCQLDVDYKALHHGSAIYLSGLDLELTVIATPGHTLDHICYLGDDKLFCGDTLFSGGCGRLFEGTAEQMHASLQRLAKLPASTQVFCTHEYTSANLSFAKAVEPSNQALIHYQQQVQDWRKLERPSLPSSIANELKINPFLRCHLPSVQESIARHSQQPVNDSVTAFKLLRQWKDSA
ncbi:hydroxyacylglutathione hydrolase [Paraferrimonas haliotis]|uniref:Hydroxyacylglutathione hydrolase n=1 Tax=Paraferrimonas haliotis TaxID=2013866 RepID=A0AA37TN37_9GAMM|nr:hydroxyacylglutathione hydrolase [Paraferrimonas haliotis]GLS84487.1 hydroxyacylglutathione hydrolase [Paraferrimonas haliotis]